MWIKTSKGSFKITSFNVHTDRRSGLCELWVSKGNGASQKIAEGQEAKISVLNDMLEYGIKHNVEIIDMTVTEVEV